MKRFSLIGLLLWLPFWGIGQTFEVSVSSRELMEGEPFEVSFILTGGEASQTQFPEFQGLEKLRGPEASQEMVNVDGSLQQRMVYRFDLVAPKPGGFLISSATAVVNQEVLSTSPIRITVGRQQEELSEEDIQLRQALERSLGRNIFFEATIESREVYVGEPVVVNYDLWVDADLSQQIGGISRENTPQFPGFSAVPLSTRNDRSLQMRRGIRYFRTKISQYQLIPQTPGTYNIDTLKVGMTVAIPRAARRPQNDLEAFQRQFQPNFMEYRYILPSSSPTLNVLPLPSAGRPVDFSGLVGQLEVETTISDSAVETGQEIHVVMLLKGNVDFGLFSPPALSLPPAIEGYSPSITPQAEGQELRVDYTLVAREPGTYELDLPAVQVFNPARRRYESMGGGTWMLEAEGESLGSGENPGEELVSGPLEFDASLMAHEQRLVSSAWMKQWFVAGLIAPWMLLGLAFILVRRKQRRIADPDFQRRLVLNRNLSRQLAAARKEFGKGNDREGYAALYQAIWSVVADRLDLAEDQQTDTHLRTAMATAVWPEQARTEVWELLTICRQQGFGITANAPQPLVDRVASLGDRIPERDTRREIAVAEWKYALSFALMMISASAFAQNTLWDQAEKYMDKRDFSAASTSYKTLYDSGERSQALFHNWSVAAYQNGSMGRAVWAAEKGLRYDPGSEVIQNNLDVLRRQINSDILPRPDLPFERMWRKSIASVGSAGWGWMALGISGLMALLFGLGWVSAPLLRWRWRMIAILTPFLILTVWIRSVSDPERPNGEGILLERGMVREAPEGQRELLSLPAGVKVYVGDLVTGWQEITILDPESGELRGFIPVGKVGKL